MAINSQKEGMNKFMLILLMSTGADIIAPNPVKEPQLKALGLADNTHFDGVDEDLNQVEDEDTKLNIIKGAIISHLRPSQMMGLHQFLHDCVVGTLEFCKDNTEYRERPDSEAMMKRLFDSDWDIDKQ